MKYTYYFAAAYGCGTYGSEQYDSSNACETTVSQQPSNGPNNVLQNTGSPLILSAISLVILIIAISIFVKTFRRKR